MPTVQYQPDQVRTQVAGTTTARAVDNGGQQLAQGINSLAQAAGEMQKQATVAETQQAANSFERDKNKIFFDPESGYFNTSGRNAYEMAGETTKRLEQLKADYGKNLSPMAQAEFNRVADSQLRNAEADILRHSSKNLKAWQQSNIEAEVENSLENSALYWNNMKALNVQREAGLQSVRESAKMQGLTPIAANEKEENFKSAFAMNTIKAAAQKSAADGDKAMELYGDALEGPDRVNISEMLDKRRDIENTKAKAGEAVLRSNNLVQTFGDRADARTAMIEEINKIEDPEMQKMVKSEATYQLNQKLAADEEERANISVKAQEYMSRPNQTFEGFKAEFTDEWAKLRPAERKALETGPVQQTDFIEYTRLRGMPPEELAKIDPVEYIGVLGKTEYKELLTRWEAARKPEDAESRARSATGQTRAQMSKAAVTSLLGSDIKDNDVPKVQAFHRLIDAEVRRIELQTGKELTSIEYGDLLNNTIRMTYLEDGFFFGQNEQTIESLEPEEIRTLSRFMSENGIPLTEDNMRKALQDLESRRGNR